MGLQKMILWGINHYYGSETTQFKIIILIVCFLKKVIKKLPIFYSTLLYAKLYFKDNFKKSMCIIILNKQFNASTFLQTDKYICPLYTIHGVLRKN